jgi:hypothetical protein
VADERSVALQVLERIQYDPLLRGQITVEVIAWDEPGADTGAVLGASWSGDGTRVLTWSDDGTPRVWLVELDQLIALAESNQLRPLNDDGLAQFFLPTLEPTIAPTPLLTITPSATPTPQRAELEVSRPRMQFCADILGLHRIALSASFADPDQGEAVWPWMVGNINPAPAEDAERPCARVQCLTRRPVA